MTTNIKLQGVPSGQQLACADFDLPRCYANEPPNHRHQNLVAELTVLPVLITTTQPSLKLKYTAREQKECFSRHETATASVNDP